MEKLNGSFSNFKCYFSQAIEFLSHHSWLFRCANTDIITEGLVDRIPLSWTQHLNLNQISKVQEAISGHCETSLPEDLQQFLKNSWLLALKTKAYPKKKLTGKKKINPKKTHEVEHYAATIGNSCEEKGVRHVVDIGSGLGYLDNELAEKYKLHVLGLERDPYRVDAATSRASESNRAYRATYKQLDVREDKPLETSIEAVVVEWFEELGVLSNQPQLCMIGLHSCGDLSPVMMRLLIKSQRFHHMFLVSCCYHRMEWNTEKFDVNNFPLSLALKLECSNETTPFHQNNYLPFLLRLAAQETPRHWLGQCLSNRKRQVTHTHFRALLQAYANKEKIVLTKQHRKAVKKQVQEDDFNSYIEQAIVGYGLTENADEHREKLTAFYNENSSTVQQVETFVILQALLQPVAEALLLIDRVAYMNEHHGVSASLVQVFDDEVSPHCFALVADK